MLKHVALVLGALTIAAPAYAVKVVSNAEGAPDPGVPAGLTTVIDFDGIMNADVDNTTVGSVYTGPVTDPGNYAKPADPFNENGNYQAVQGNATSTFDFTDVYDDGRTLGRFSLYWGSIDEYNTLSFLTAGGTLVKSFTGFDFPPANGDQPAALTNRRITFGFSQADAVTQVRFQSSQNAFEFDTLAIAAVPEPASWAMLIAGFGLVGATLRRRRQQTGSVLA